ncbi:glycine amidinotransferase [Deltaproteobacteria bacterium IMCC39524]|nr:glycine amidinotransferase [Deltaproteobacteria bacterium IMCC39524]
MVNSHNEWDSLKEVIVGNTFLSNLPGLELSFKLFFHDSLTSDVFGNDVYSQKGKNWKGEIKKQYIDEHEEDITEMVRVLEEESVTVKRPKRLDKIHRFKTPYWESGCVPALNIRDQAIIVGNEIIETPPQVRSRFFENDLLKEIFMDYFKKGARWTQIPKPMLTDNSFDISYQLKKGVQYEKQANHFDIGYEILFDGAQCLRFNNDIVINCSNENHLLGAQWLKRHLKGYNLHVVRMVDNHIDSTMLPLREGVLLVNPRKFKEEHLPDFLKKWDRIFAPEPEAQQTLLASKFIDMNVLSLDPKKIMVSNNYIPLIRLLEQNGFTPIPVQLRHRRLFGGGFHCITLDTIRR